VHNAERLISKCGNQFAPFDSTCQESKNWEEGFTDGLVVSRE
jgi:hypothetical protein